MDMNYGVRFFQPTSVSDEQQLPVFGAMGFDCLVYGPVVFPQGVPGKRLGWYAKKESYGLSNAAARFFLHAGINACKGHGDARAGLYVAMRSVITHLARCP